jgi:hypothetical protein
MAEALGAHPRMSFRPFRGVCPSASQKQRHHAGNEQPAEKRTFSLPKTRRAASAGLYGPQRPCWSYYGHSAPPFLKWRPHFPSGAARFPGRRLETRRACPRGCCAGHPVPIISWVRARAAGQKEKIPFLAAEVRAGKVSVLGNRHSSLQREHAVL